MMMTKKKLRKEIDRLSDIITDYEDANARLWGENATMRTNLQEAEQENDELQTVIAKLRSQIFIKNRLLVSIQSEKESAQAEKESAKSELEAKEDELEKMRAKCICYEFLRNRAMKALNPQAEEDLPVWTESKCSAANPRSLAIQIAVTCGMVWGENILVEVDEYHTEMDVREALLKLSRDMDLGVNFLFDYVLIGRSRVFFEIGDEFDRLREEGKFSRVFRIEK